MRKLYAIVTSDGKTFEPGQEAAAKAHEKDLKRAARIEELIEKVYKMQDSFDMDGFKSLCMAISQHREEFRKAIREN